MCFALQDYCGQGGSVGFHQEDSTNFLGQRQICKVGYAASKRKVKDNLQVPFNVLLSCIQIALINDIALLLYNAYVTC